MKIKQEQPEGRPLWEGHRERLRRRMEREGWDALKPYEMVELALYHAVPRQDLSDIARLLVDSFGTVGGVFAASREQLLAVEGMTPTLAEWVGLTGELIRAYRDMNNVRDIQLGSYREVLDFLRPCLAEHEGAGAWVLYADYGFNLITYTELKVATPWWEAANARRMLVEAIGNGARFVYLVLWTEDPPAGLTEAEAARIDAIAATLRAADLDLVDCLLAGGGEIYSMNIHGKMNAIRAASGCQSVHERYAEDG